MRKLGEFVHSPERIKSKIPNTVMQMGLGSLGSWSRWVKRQPTLSQRLAQRVNTKYRRR